jgi:ABC-type polysaccharide/polyol phosphate transport system ATPase subunit
VTIKLAVTAETVIGLECGLHIELLVLSIIQGEHKGTLHFQNYTENKCGIVRTSHLHQSIERLSKTCTLLTETRYVLRESHGRCRDDNPTRPKLCAECF